MCLSYSVSVFINYWGITAILGKPRETKLGVMLLGEASIYFCFTEDLLDQPAHPNKLVLARSNPSVFDICGTIKALFFPNQVPLNTLWLTRRMFPWSVHSLLALAFQWVSTLSRVKTWSQWMTDLMWSSFQHNWVWSLFTFRPHRIRWRTFKAFPTIYTSCTMAASQLPYDKWNTWNLIKGEGDHGQYQVS